MRKNLRLRQTVLALLLMVLAVFSSSSFANAATVARSSLSTQRPSGNSSSGSFGLGIMLGDPSGLSVKSWLSQKTALQFGLTYSFDNYVALLGDFLWHFPQTFNGPTGSQFVPYVGVGGCFMSYEPPSRRSALDLAVRVPLGLEFLPTKAPLGVFAEIVPAVSIIPDVFGFFQADIGIRFYL